MASEAIPRPVTAEAKPGSHVRVYIAACVALGLISLILTHLLWAGEGFGRLWVAALFLCLMSFDQSSDIRFIYRRSGIKKDLAEMFLIPLALTLPPVGVFDTFMLAVVIGLIVRRKAFDKIAFNTSMFGICLFVFLLIFRTIAPIGSSMGVALIALGVAGVIFFILNALIVAGIVARADAVSLAEIFKNEAGLMPVVLLGNVTIGILCGIALNHQIGLLPLLIPAGLLLHLSFAGRMRSMTDSERLGTLMQAATQAYLPDSPEGAEMALVELAQQMVKAEKAYLRNEAPALENECGVEVDVLGEKKWLVVVGMPRRRFTNYDRDLLKSLGLIGSSSLAVAAAHKLNNDLRTQSETARIQSEMVITLSHELRTPLTSIIGFASTILTLDISEEQKKEFLELIHSQALHLNGLVNTFLDFQSISAGTLTLSKEVFDIAPEVCRSTGIFEVISRQDIICDCPGPVMVEGDIIRLNHVVENLLSNALKYSPDGGQIAVRGKVEGDYFHLEVEDHGVGIPEDKKEELFSRFTRLRSNKTSHTAGTGLGLAFCKEVIEMHGGKIGFSSNEGEGSTFWIKLPIYKAPSSKASA
jgi:signal transduction histidine kinase